mgnify:CR=1 FL=1
MLEQIVEHKVQEIGLRKNRCPLDHIRSVVAFMPQPRAFGVSLRQPGKVTVIAEIKKASPSKGPIKPDADPAAVAQIYAAEGAAAISVLTDERFFLGSPGFLGIVRQAVGLPLLYKDFVVDPYQVFEARFLGADAVLLIARLYTKQELAELLTLAEDIGIECLVEVHTEQEVEQALRAGAKIIGINNRDLETFKTDTGTTFRLRPYIPPDIVVVSESGISSPASVRALKRCGVDAVLVGEALMTSDDIAAKLRELVAAGAE